MTDLQQELKRIADLRRKEWERMLDAPIGAGFSQDQLDEAEIKYHEAQAEWLRSMKEKTH
jgi:hypothetical protein